MDKTKPSLYLLEVQNIPILQQLQWEEALLRTDHRNWCLINKGSPPAIVMGISGKPAELINLNKIESHPIPVIKRFSGGGTVVVNEETLFITLICQQNALPIHPYPRSIMEWTSQLYTPLFAPHAFTLEENDYTLNGRKWGGNAQMITKNRWLHHTSILWDFEEEQMDYLLYPKRVPAYRNNRAHIDFICRLSDQWQNIQDFQQGFIQQLKHFFTIFHGNLNEIEMNLTATHRQATTILSKSELKTPL